MFEEGIDIIECCKKPGQFSGIIEVSSKWNASDYVGSIKCRIINSFRMKYKIDPGLYRIGEPDENSDVFASANYKLSFDILRKSLAGLNAWILVLDTKGINVWCAAGKGTFGTDELVRRINETNLGSFLNHRRVIVPQLGAVGVNSDAVYKKSGFRVYFGPVYAKDIKDYLKGNKKKTLEMRGINFSLAERIILIPMEIIPAMKLFLVFAIIAILFFGLEPGGILFKEAWSGGIPFLLLGLASVIGGTLITPALLPFIPFRSFALKGWIVGILSVIITLFFLNPGLYLSGQKNILVFVAGVLFFPMASSYFALQFTGSTTFTNMSGVKKELKIALPVYYTVAGISILLLIIYKLHQFGIA